MMNGRVENWPTHVANLGSLVLALPEELGRKDIGVALVYAHYLYLHHRDIFEDIAGRESGDEKMDATRQDIQELFTTAFGERGAA